MITSSKLYRLRLSARRIIDTTTKSWWQSIKQFDWHSNFPMGIRIRMILGHMKSEVSFNILGTSKSVSQSCVWWRWCPAPKSMEILKKLWPSLLPLTYYDFCAMFLSFVCNKWLCFCNFFPLFIIIQLSLVFIIKLLLNLYINISTSQLDPKPLLTNYFLSYLLLSYSLTTY